MAIDKKESIEVNGVKYYLNPKKQKRKFSKGIIRLCLIVMTVIFVADFLLCWRANEQMDSTTIAAFAGFWGAEVFSAAWIKATEVKTEAARLSAERYSTDHSQEVNHP